jgi:multicomponent Na+:H+ antiporter subunit G
MVDSLLHLIGWILLMSGSAFSIVGGVGIVRFPDFYSRLHGGGITDTLGAGFILIGLMFITFSFEFASLLVVLKLITILLFLMVTSPTGCHALAQAALTSGLRPLTGKPGQEKDPEQA